MTAESAGILLYRRSSSTIEVFLAHPGGPFWAGKDLGAWTIPKGTVEDGEEKLAAAVREFREETGLVLTGPFIELGCIRQKSGKIVHAWACEGDADPAAVRSDYVSMRWAGKLVTVPEVDRCQWFAVETAIQKINVAQAALILRLVEIA